MNRIWNIATILGVPMLLVVARWLDRLIAAAGRYTGNTYDFAPMFWVPPLATIVMVMLAGALLLALQRSHVRGVVFALVCVVVGGLVAFGAALAYSPLNLFVPYQIMTVIAPRSLVNLVGTIVLVLGVYELVVALRRR